MGEYRSSEVELGYQRGWAHTENAQPVRSGRRALGPQPPPHHPLQSRLRILAVAAHPAADTGIRPGIALE